MSKQPDSTVAPPGGRGPADRLSKAAGLVALSAALVVALLFSVRYIASPDLGYHLAYGDEFFRTGEITTHCEYVYTLPPTDLPADRRPEPGPGCWYDDQGRYRFPNANWGSQVLFIAAWRMGGLTGLWLLRIGLVLAVFGGVLLAMRRLGITALPAGAGVLMIALIAYPRLTLRPELVGYALLVWQFVLLTARRYRLRTVILPALLQILFLNVHSYFYLGLGLTAAVVLALLGRHLWNRFRNRQRDEELRRNLRWVSLALLVQVVACFVSPFGWRLAALPIQTIIFLRTYQPSPEFAATGLHPWMLITELMSPLGGPVEDVSKAAIIFRLMLLLGGLGLIAALLRRRWAWAMWLIGMGLVAMSLRRNTAVGALVVVPVAIAALTGLLRPLWERMKLKPRRIVAWASAGLIAVVCVGVCVSVVTHSFYYSERSYARFGHGWGYTYMPTGLSRWLSENTPGGRLWTDINTSSNVYFFTRPRPEGVPALTNTWVYPPAVMEKLLLAQADYSQFRPLLDEYTVDVVAIRMDASSAPAFVGLSKDDGWAMVFLDNWHGVFLRRGRRNDELIRRHEITRTSLDLAALQALLRTYDPRPAYQFKIAGDTLNRLEWYDPAVEMLRASVQLDPHYAPAVRELGRALAIRGRNRIAGGMILRGRKDISEARDLFVMALRLDPADEKARRNLQIAEEDLKRH